MRELQTREAGYDLLDRLIHGLACLYGAGAQVMHKLFYSYMQGIQQVRIGRNVLFPPPAGKRPGTFLQPRIDARDKTVSIENGQDVVAPFALVLGFINLPQVVKIEELEQRLAIPEEAIQRPQEKRAWFERRLVQQL